MNFQDVQPENLALPLQEPAVPSPFVFQDEMPVDMETARIEAEEARAYQPAPVEEPVEEDLRGPQGEPGETGPQGEPGADGRDGLDGLDGADGKNGVDGRDGKDGKNGKDGKDGKQGVKGERGLTGKAGKDGKPGKDGSPDTGKEIVAKVNELEIKPELQIDFPHIKNFPWQEVQRRVSDGWVGGYGALDFNLKTVTLAQITSNQNDYAVGLGAFFRASSDASRTITGIEGGMEGRSMVLVNVGSNNIVLANQSASSGGINRIITGTGANMTLAPDDVAILTYDNVTERWRVWESTPTGSNPDAATESLTPTQVGNDITLDLTGLSNTFSVILGIFRNGQLVTSGTSGGSDGSSRWSRAGNIVTVYNAADSDFFSVQYTY